MDMGKHVMNSNYEMTIIETSCENSVTMSEEGQGHQLHSYRSNAS